MHSVKETYCNNLKCRYFKPLLMPVEFNFDKPHFKAFESSHFTGKCDIIDHPDMMDYCETIENHRCNSAICLAEHVNRKFVSELPGQCAKTNCLFNQDREKKCFKDVIFVDASSDAPETFECKSYSRRGCPGHRDWFSLLNPDKTAKGGQIDDNYANKMYRDSLKYQSFPDGHHRDAKEAKGKK
jgi:hypothetical protein